MVVMVVGSNEDVKTEGIKSEVSYYLTVCQQCWSDGLFETVFSLLTLSYG